jgi:hypothetical protein
MKRNDITSDANNSTNTLHMRYNKHAYVGQIDWVCTSKSLIGTP